MPVIGTLSLSPASRSGLKGQEKAANHRKLCSASPRSCRSGTETELLFGVLFGGDFGFVLIAHGETFIWLPLTSQKRKEIQNKCFVFLFVCFLKKLDFHFIFKLYKMLAVLLQCTKINSVDGKLNRQQTTKLVVFLFLPNCTFIFSSFILLDDAIVLKDK